MSYQPKDNSGALFKNDKGGVETRPDYRGDLIVNGEAFELAGWIKTSQKGDKFMSLSAKPKEARQQRQEPARAPQRQAATNWTTALLTTMNTRIEAGTAVLAQQGVEMADEPQPVAWRVRGYAQFKTGKPGPWRYIDGAIRPKVNDPDCCDIEPLYARGIPGAVDEHGGNSGGN